MSDTCPTVFIKSDNDYGYVEINKSDLKEGDKVIGGIPGEEKSKAKALTKPELVAALTEAGVNVDPKTKKPELQAMFDGLATDPE